MTPWKFCPHCGEELDEQQLHTHPLEYPGTDSAKGCASCGEKVDVYYNGQCHRCFGLRYTSSPEVTG